MKVEGRWDVLGIDLIGPFKVILKDSKHVITMTDLFTKWLVGYPRNGKSGPISPRVVANMIHTYGPSLKITDQGRQFVNEVNKRELCCRKLIMW